MLTTLFLHMSQPDNGSNLAPCLCNNLTDKGNMKVTSGNSCQTIAICIVCRPISCSRLLTKLEVDVRRLVARRLRLYDVLAHLADTRLKTVRPERAARVDVGVYPRHLRGNDHAVDCHQCHLRSDAVARDIVGYSTINCMTRLPGKAWIGHHEKQHQNFITEIVHCASILSFCHFLLKTLSNSENLSV